MSEFFAMGGYASFIWPAYGISALVLIGILLQSRAAWHRASREVASLEEGAPVYESKANSPESAVEATVAPAPDTAP